MRKSYKFWSDSERTFLQNNYKYKSVEEIALNLNRTLQSVYKKAAQLGLRRGWKPSPPPPPPLKITDVEMLRNLYCDKELSISEVSKKLGCSRRTVGRALVRYGILKRSLMESRLIAMKKGVEGWDVTYTEEEKKLLALAIDLEGSIKVSRTSPKTLAPKIEIVNTNYELLNYVQSIAKVGGIYKKRIKKRNRKRAWVWEVAAFLVVQNLLRQISPYLIAKKKQAELTLEFCRIRLENFGMPLLPREREIYLEMKELNRRGVIPSKTVFSIA